MKSFFNRILLVDLTGRSSRVLPVGDQTLAAGLGGKGLATRLLLEFSPPGVDPLAPAAALIFAAGPATDQKVYGSARYGVFFKSPQTGLYAESYSGGSVADKLSRTGFDAIVISGRADRPTLLEVNEDGAVLHDAADLWGMSCYDTEDEALKRFGKDAAAVVIGPAGERQVRFAIIANDRWRCAGRAGGGAVMGAKNLKAIVFRGSARRAAADPERLARLFRELMELAKTAPGAARYKKYGTVQMVKVANEAGVFPTNYWRAGARADYAQIDGDALLRDCEVKARSCPRCFMACANLSTVREGPYQGLQIEGPEYETIYSFAGLCLIPSLPEVMHLNDLCDRLGLDTITAGNLVGFAMLASEQGRIPERIPFGDTAAAAALIESIVRREGLGVVLSAGIRAAASAWGMEDEAVHVKGMEPAGYDPRKLIGMGLAYAVSDRGACHLRATFYKPELAGISPQDRLDDKAAIFIDFEDRATLFDTLILCRFYRDLMTWERLGELIAGLTGLDGSKASLEKIAARVSDDARRFNLREGLTAADDCLPRALFRPMEGKSVTPAEIERLVRDYYRLRGWNEFGVPN